MKNILASTLLTGLAISTISAPANAVLDWERRQDEALKEKRYQEDRRNDRQEWDRKNAPGNGISPATPSSGSSDGSGLEGLGAIFSLFNFGPSAISSNGNIQYGVQSKFGFENIRVRTAMHFGSGSAINGAFTYSLNGQPTMFNPFIGGGIGYKTIQKPGQIDTNAFAFYGTGGVDLNLTDNLSISGAVNLPTDSTYGTEFQAAINFFGSF